MKKGHLKSNLLSFMTTLTVGVSGLLSFMILIRSYSKVDYAEWVFYIAIVNFVDWLRGGLITSALIKHLSGAKSHSKKMEILGSSWTINLLSVIIIALICYIPLAFFGSTDLIKKFYFVAKYYPLYAFCNSIISMNVSVLQVQNRFFHIFLLRLALSLGTLFFYTGNIMWLDLPIEGVISGQIIIMGIVTSAVLCTNIVPLQSIFQSKIERIKKLLHFGKYSMGIAIGGNLLCSSDIFIIGMMMTKIDVALYSVPLKVVEYVQIVLSSFTEVAYPHMSEHSNNNEPVKTKEIFYKYSGTLTILLAPAIILMFFFAKYVILLMSGSEYANSTQIIFILQLFLISALFLPVDRFSGTLLDSLGLPKYNFIKVMSMVCVNIAGDFIAIIYFQSLELVALITILTNITGLIISYKYLFAEININFIKIFPHGFEVCRNGINVVKKKG